MHAACCHLYFLMHAIYIVSCTSVASVCTCMIDIYRSWLPQQSQPQSTQSKRAMKDIISSSMQ